MDFDLYQVMDFIRNHGWTSASDLLERKVIAWNIGRAHHILLMLSRAGYLESRTRLVNGHMETQFRCVDDD